MSSDELNTPIFDNFVLAYYIRNNNLPPAKILNYSVIGGSVFSQVKYLLENKQYDLARKIILEYSHLFKRDYLLKNYPNLFTQQELNFISSVLSEYKIEQIIPLLSQISKQQEQKQQISKTTKYQSLKEKLQKHPLKNKLKNFRFKRILKLGSRGEDVKYLQIILNLDEYTKLTNRGRGSFGKEYNYFDSLTQKAVIKFQKKYLEYKKPTGIIDKKTLQKLNEILNEIN
jgi:hypothetical protein